MIKLKLCPFCGEPGSELGDNQIACENGCISGDPFAGDLPTAETWNNRPVEDAIKAELNSALAEVAALRSESAMLAAELRNLRALIGNVGWDAAREIAFVNPLAVTL